MKGNKGVKKTKLFWTLIIFCCLILFREFWSNPCTDWSWLWSNHRKLPAEAVTEVDPCIVLFWWKLYKKEAALPCFHCKVWVFCWTLRVCEPKTTSFTCLVDLIAGFQRKCVDVFDHVSTNSQNDLIFTFYNIKPLILGFVIGWNLIGSILQPPSCLWWNLFFWLTTQM